jgi:hypothetical protein
MLNIPLPFLVTFFQVLLLISLKFRLRHYFFRYYTKCILSTLLPCCKLIITTWYCGVLQNLLTFRQVPHCCSSWCPLENKYATTFYSRKVYLSNFVCTAAITDFKASNSFSTFIMSSCLHSLTDLTQCCLHNVILFVFTYRPDTMLEATDFVLPLDVASSHK